METYKIIPLKVGLFAGMEKSGFTYMIDPGVKIPCPCISYLIESDAPDYPVRILVDSGPGDKEFASNPQGFFRTEEMKIENALRSYGYSTDDINCLIMTHLHWDHCFNLELFPGKKIYVQRAEYEYALDPPAGGEAINYVGPKAGFTQPWWNIKDQMVLVDGDVNLYSGIDLVTLPGHSIGFQGILVNTKEGKYLIAGDCIPLLENWEGNATQKHIPCGWHGDLKQVYATYDKIEALCDFVLPGHDIRVFEHQSYPILRS